MSSSRHITTTFTYHRPETLDETLRLLQEHDRVQILAGGTDLLIQMRTGEKTPDSVVDILRVKELNRIEYDDGMRIGAAVQFYQLEHDATVTEVYPALYDAVKSVAGVQIRNMATLAGNLCNASPIADSATPLMVLNALLEIRWLDSGGKTCTRDVPIEEFFTGPGLTILEKGQLVSAVHIPQPPPNSASSFIKVCRVTLDLAKISCAAFIERNGSTIQTARVAIGGAAPTPVRAHAVEDRLSGKRFHPELIEAGARETASDISPIKDVRSTEDYRRNVASVIVKDAVVKAWKESGGEVVNE